MQCIFIILNRPHRRRKEEEEEEEGKTSKQLINKNRCEPVHYEKKTLKNIQPDISK